MHGGAPLPFWMCLQSSLYNCAPSGAKHRFAGTISGSVVVQGPRAGLNASLGIKVPLCQKKKLWTILRKSVLFLTKKGHVLLSKWHFYLEKRALLGVEFLESKRPGPLIPPPLTVPLQRQWEGSWGQFPSSAVAIGATMRQDKCPIKA